MRSADDSLYVAGDRLQRDREALLAAVVAGVRRGHAATRTRGCVPLVFPDDFLRTVTCARNLC
jgi:hypothetical protein